MFPGTVGDTLFSNEAIECLEFDGYFEPFSALYVCSSRMLPLEASLALTPQSNNDTWR